MDASVIKSRVKLGLSRIVTSRAAFSFFLVTFITSITEIAVLSTSYVNDFNMGIRIHHHMAVNTTVFALFSDTGGVNNGPAVKLCTNVTNPENPTCDFIPVGPNAPAISSGSINGSFGVNPTCQQALNFPLQALALFKREHTTNIGINAWLLFIANYAIMAESPPHLVAFLAGRTFSSAWAIYTFLQAAKHKPEFDAMLYHSPCSTTSIINDDYWKERSIIQSTSTIVNLVGLFVSAYLCFKLVSKYNSETYARVCASPCLITMYRFVLTLNAATQLGLFFFIASGALWLDRLLMGGVIRWVQYPKIYVGLFGLTVALVPFWSAFGWYGVRRENKYLMIAYLSIVLFFVASWGAMFKSIIYRFYFINWAFWSFITVIGMILLVFIVLLTLFCWWNFGKGIKHWLYVTKTLSSSNFAPSSFDPDPYELPSHKVMPMDPEFEFVLEGPTKHISAHDHDGDSPTCEIDLKTPDGEKAGRYA